eukprot:UN01417
MFHLLALVALFVVSECHMCLVSPYQRGAPVTHADFDKQGADVCGLTTGPCGGVNASNSEFTVFEAGERISVVLQKNLDHFNKDAPGNFTVAILHPNTTRYNLGIIKDDDAPSGSLYPINGQIPPMDEGRYVLQAVYHTNNPNAPAAFYQCADIGVHPRQNALRKVPRKVKSILGF